MKINKHADAEFNEYGLPHNRKEVFFDCIKTRFDVIMLCGLWLLICFLPYIVIKIYGETVFVTLYNTLDDPVTANESADIWLFYLSIAYLPCYIVIAVGLAGTAKVIRTLIWGEAVFFRQDFLSGIKGNGGAYIAVFLIYGAAKIFYSFIMTMNVSNAFLLYIPIGLFIIAGLPIGMIMLSQAAVYKVKFFDLLKNSFKLFIKTVPQNLVFVLALSALLSTDLITITILKYILIILEILFLLCPFVMARMLFDCSVFDKYINSRDYPEMVDKGLVRLDKIKG